MRAAFALMVFVLMMPLTVVITVGLLAYWAGLWLARRVWRVVRELRALAEHNDR